MGKLQSEGAELKFFCTVRYAVFPVACQRVPHVRHLEPDLMMPSGVQMDLNESGIFAALDHFIVQPCKLCPWSLRGTDARDIAAAVLYHVIFQCTLQGREHR